MSDFQIPAQHLQAILDAIPDGIGVELEGVIVWANLGFARLYGYPSVRDVLGKPTAEFVTPQDQDRLSDYAIRRDGTGNAPNHYFFRGRRMDGSPVDVEIFATSFESGGRRYILGALRDQTERVMLARRLELSQRLEALGTLARGISHDFNNLLGSILGNTDLAEITLQRGGDPRRYLERIRKAGEKGSALTRQLQTFTGHRPWEGQAAPVFTILKDPEELLAHSCRNVRTTVRASRDLPAASMAPGQLQQILMNLATNAMDAMPDGGLLTMTCQVAEVSREEAHPDEQPGTYLRFSVEDTGAGIRQSDLPRIFEPFFTTKPADKGTGLGLSVVFGAIRSHHGWIEVESELGHGTRFLFWLPIQHAQAEEEVEEASPDLRAREGEVVLVVDDNPGMRTFIQDALLGYGYGVVTAENGAAAFKVMEMARPRPGVAVLDLVMPEMDGVECALALLHRYPTLRILLCTGLVQDDRISALPSAIRARVLRKPVTANRLLREIRHALKT